MKAVKVQYTVQPEYAAQNKANIQKVMNALQAHPIEGLQYSSFTLDDGQTFVHINMAKDADTMAKLSEMEEFQAFRKALKASAPVKAPQADSLDLVGAGFEL